MCEDTVVMRSPIYWGKAVHIGSKILKSFKETGALRQPQTSDPRKAPSKSSKCTEILI